MEWVLLTGASSGIGAELAKIFASRGHAVVLLARNLDRLTALGSELEKGFGVKVRVLQKDLGKPSAPKEIFDELERDSIPVSILVNNAGFGLVGGFAEQSIAIDLEMLQVNVGALVELTHLFVRPMLERRKGRILNVASTAAFQPGPLMAMYYASKAFVWSFSHALSEELDGTGVTVTTLCPGPTRTEFFKRAGTERSERLARRWSLSAERVAEAGYEGLMKGKRVVVPGLMNKLGVFLSRRAPLGLPAKLAKRFNEV